MLGKSYNMCIEDIEGQSFGKRNNVRLRVPYLEYGDKAGAWEHHRPGIGGTCRRLCTPGLGASSPTSYVSLLSFNS